MPSFPLAFPHVQKFLDHRSLPKDSSRHAVISLMWACVGVASVQFILAVTVLAHWKNLREVHKWRLQQHQQQQQLQQQLTTAVQPLAAGQPTQYGTAPPPPPPPPGYPAIAAAGSSSVPPPLTPPTGSCPYNVPLQPAGQYPYATPPGGNPAGYGAAPLLGGYVSSTVVPPGGGGGNVLLPQQPAAV